MTGEGLFQSQKCWRLIRWKRERVRGMGVWHGNDCHSSQNDQRRVDVCLFLRQPFSLTAVSLCFSITLALLKELPTPSSMLTQTILFLLATTSLSLVFLGNNTDDNNAMGAGGGSRSRAPTRRSCSCRRRTWTRKACSRVRSRPRLRPTRRSEPSSLCKSTVSACLLCVRVCVCACVDRAFHESFAEKEGMGMSGATKRPVASPEPLFIY